MDSELVAHCLELLAPLGGPRARRMFGGHGFYLDGVFVALLSAERLYLKADALSRPRFEAAGCVPFAYDTREGRRVALGFFTAPEEAMESPALMQPWARLALEVALRARAAKVAPKATTKRTTQRTAKRTIKRTAKRTSRA